MDVKTLAAAAGIDEALATQWAGHLTAGMARYGVDTPQRQAAFIAQAGHESAGFTRVVENLNYSAEGLAATWPSRFASKGEPNDLARQIARKPELIANAAYGLRNGNNNAGDGWKYRGRGLFQVTGKGNYSAVGRALGLDLVNQPELLEQRSAAALSAAQYWSSNRLNELADRGDIDAISRKINGGSNGLDDRRARYNKALRVLTA